MNCIASKSAAALSTLSPHEPRASVGRQKPLEPSVCQLFRLNQFLLLAVFSKSPDPIEIINDRSTTKVALSPHINYRTLVLIERLLPLAHELLDVSCLSWSLRKLGSCRGKRGRNYQENH